MEMEPSAQLGPAALGADGLTPQRVREIVGQWLTLAQNPERPTTAADVYHSSLLGRLLEGKEPVKWKPPRAFSYPWYELCDEGVSEGAMEASHYPDGVFNTEFPAVLICQAIWKDEGDGLVRWPDPDAPWLCRLTRVSEPEVAGGWATWRLEVVEGPESRPQAPEHAERAHNPEGEVPGER